MAKKKETSKTVDGVNLVFPAKELLDAIIDSADALARQPLTEQRITNLKLVLGFINACIGSYRPKVNYFRLVGFEQKLAHIKGLEKKRKN